MNILQEIKLPVSDDEKYGLFIKYNYVLLDNSSYKYVLSTDTYFNMFYLKKWKYYTDINKFYIALKVIKRCKIDIYGLNENNSEFKIDTLCIENTDEKNIVYEIKDVDCLAVFLKIYCFDREYPLEYARLATDCKYINSVNISVVITTFEKEKYLYKNISAFKNLFKNEELSKHFHVYIIDNGQTIDKTKISDENFSVIKNFNTGGAGGFARGIIETLKSDTKYSHVLLMDDDVQVEDISFILLYRLLCYVSDRFKKYFIGGAMFDILFKNIKHASLEWFDDIKFWSNPGPRDLLLRKEVIRSDIDVAHENQYQAWWFCAIPLEVLSYKNLPYPCFFQGDDTEFSLRNHAKIILFNGICTWHEPFYKKEQNFKPYFSFRNLLIFSCIHNIYNELIIILKIISRALTEIRQFNYSGAQVFIDVLNDFMKGPRILYSYNDTLKILQNEILSNEKLLPLSKFLNINQIQDFSTYADYNNLPLLKRVINFISVNGLFFPDFLRNKNIGTANYWGRQPRKFYLMRKVFVVDPINKLGNIREFDRKKGFEELIKLIKCILLYIIKRKKIRQEYKNNFNYMTSIDFYRKYLNLKN